MQIGEQFEVSDFRVLTSWMEWALCPLSLTISQFGHSVLPSQRWVNCVPYPPGPCYVFAQKLNQPKNHLMIVRGSVIYER